MRRIKKYLQPIYWVYVYLPLMGLMLLGAMAYLRISGDISVCRNYYPEMSTAECYFSSKTVRVPGGSK